VSTDFSLILQNVQQLARLRAGRASNTPKIQLSYLMTKASLSELPQAVELARTLGVDELYATNLDYLVTAAHDDLRAFGCSPLRDEFVRLVEAARERARKIGLAFRAYPLDLEEVAVCEAHPMTILFVSCDGWVSPCSYLALPGQAEIPRGFEGRQVSVPAVRFGNVQDQELTDIWDGPAWREFRRRFAARRMGLAARAVAAVSGDGGSDSKMPPPPEPCRTCYKLLGV
jgi:MoaA/NifB/PqqE/SkfB family radical SAM enzyme